MGGSGVGGSGEAGSGEAGEAAQGPLHDDRGDVAVEGLLSGPADDVDYPVDRLRAESGISEGVELIGTGSVVERLWSRPALAVIGFDATATKDASNTLIPVARAKVSVRVAPGDTRGGEHAIC